MMMMMSRLLERVINGPQTRCRSAEHVAETRRAQLRLRWAGGLEHSSVIRTRTVWHWKFQTPPQNCSFSAMLLLQYLVSI